MESSNKNIFSNNDIPKVKIIQKKNPLIITLQGGKCGGGYIDAYPKSAFKMISEYLK